MQDNLPTGHGSELLHIHLKLVSRIINMDVAQDIAMSVFQADIGGHVMRDFPADHFGLLRKQFVERLCYGNQEERRHAGVVPFGE